MPGFLSQMFDPEPHDSSDTQQVQSGDESYEASEGSLDQSADANLDVEVTLSVHTETSVQYETEDEAGGWTNTSDVTLTVSADALLKAATEGSYDNEAES